MGAILLLLLTTHATSASLVVATDSLRVTPGADSLKATLPDTLVVSVPVPAAVPTIVADTTLNIIKRETTQVVVAESVLIDTQQSLGVATVTESTSTPIKMSSGCVTSEVFLAQAFFEAIKTALKPLPYKGINTLYFKASEQHKENYMVEDAMHTLLQKTIPSIRMEDGLNIAYPAFTTSTDTTARASKKSVEPDSAINYVLEYRVVQGDVGIGTPFKKGILGTKKVVRTATANCSFRLLQLPEYALIWKGVGHYEHKKIMKNADVAATETKKYTYSRVTPKTSFWKTATEALLAGGTVGTLMFLFFTQSFN